jgi:hypothetical protein
MNNLIFYDLETNGLDYYTTGILQISMLDLDRNIIINNYVYPFDNRIECTHIHGIDENKLKENNALTTVDLCIHMKKILREIYGREDIYFIAYNNFGYDQVILENNFRLSKVNIPHNWYFIDLYPIIKELYKSKFLNFKLKTVYETLFPTNKNVSFHSSLDDTDCLVQIFNQLIEDNNLTFDLLKKYTRTLLSDSKIFECPISTLQGYSNTINFESKNIKFVGDLFELYKKFNYDEVEFEKYLQKNVGIYSEYFLKNIVKQINVIKNFHNL